MRPITFDYFSKIKISKKQKMRFLFMSQGSLNPKIRFLGQTMCSVARGQTDTHIDRQTHTKVNTEDTLSGFQECFLQPIIKDRSNYDHSPYTMISSWKQIGK